MAAHTIGYVGRINDREQKQIDPNLYESTNVIGKTGIEAFYESTLLGKPGYQEVESNARGRVLRTLNNVDPVPGQDLHLYLDLDLQKVAMEAMRGKRGAVVALDPKTGGVLAMVSSPSYDTNAFVTGISYKDYGALRDNINRPLYDRAALGEYPPASTIKPFISLAALDSDTIKSDYRIFDSGYYQLPGDDHRYRNWKREGDGWTDLRRAIRRSNDTYFYDIAVKMGIDNIHKYLTLYGLGTKTGLDIASERPRADAFTAMEDAGTRRPVVSGRDRYHRYRARLYADHAAATGDGNGDYCQPGQDGKTAAGQARPWRCRYRTAIVTKHKKDWETVIQGMIDVVSHPRGTAYLRMGKNVKYSVAGKTGTAQVVGIPQDLKEEEARVLEEFQKDHGLFVAFAPVDDPKIAIAVVVENDSKMAVPVAKKVMDAWLLPTSGHELPNQNQLQTATGAP